MKRLLCKHEAVRCTVKHSLRSHEAKRTFFIFHVAKQRFIERSSASFFMHHRCASLQPKTKKQSIGLLSFLVAGAGFEPYDLRVMSPTSYQAAPPRDKTRFRVAPFVQGAFLFYRILFILSTVFIRFFELF